jgi:hypothetical protein
VARFVEFGVQYSRSPRVRSLLLTDSGFAVPHIMAYVGTNTNPSFSGCEDNSFVSFPVIDKVLKAV